MLGIARNLVSSGARQAAVGLVMGAGALLLGIAIRFGWTKIVKAFVWVLVGIALLVVLLQLNFFPKLEKRLLDNRIVSMLSVGEQQGWRPETEKPPQTLGRRLGTMAQVSFERSGNWRLLRLRQSRALGRSLAPQPVSGVAGGVRHHWIFAGHGNAIHTDLGLDSRMQEFA